MLRLGWIKPREKKRIYLDYAAATPLRPGIAMAMAEVTAQCFGNASAIHREGQQARERVEASRLTLARCLKIRPEGVVFTASGTESNNLALYGAVRATAAAGRAYESMSIISTELEHPSTLAVLADLAIQGVTIKYVAVDENGRIDQTHLRTLLDDSVVLVSIAYVNSEVGVVQDVSRIARIVKKWNQAKNANVLLHIDAAQAPLWLPCQFDCLGVDLMSLDAGKCYGPKGVGVLAFRHGVTLVPQVRGGGQEFGLRAATENTPGIVGASLALTQAQADWETRSAAVTTLRDQLIASLTALQGVVLNGSAEHRVANNVNISMSGVDGEFAAVSLDEAGVAVSTRSACGGAGGGGSAVVKAITGDVERSTTTLRLTLGEETTSAEIKAVSRILAMHITTTRNAQQQLTQT